MHYSKGVPGEGDCTEDIKLVEAVEAIGRGHGSVSNGRPKAERRNRKNHKKSVNHFTTPANLG